MTIKLCDCESSNLAGYGYDEATKTLAVKFRSTGDTFHYAGVPKEAFEQFGNAPSKGSYFAKHIRSQFKGVKQDRAKEAA